MYAVQSESILYICRNIKQLLAGNKRGIWSLSGNYGRRSYNRLNRKRTLNHLAKLTKGLGYVVSIYMYGSLNSILLSCQVRISEWIHTLYLPECQGTPCSKQAWYLKFMWLQLDSNPQLISLTKLTKWLSCVVSTYLYCAFDFILLLYHVHMAEWIHTLYLSEFQTTPCSNRRDIWSLRDCNGTRCHNHLGRKRTLNHLSKLTEWLSCVVSTYLYGGFDCMLLSCQVRILELIHTLYFPEWYWTPWSKQVR